MRISLLLGTIHLPAAIVAPAAPQKPFPPLPSNAFRRKNVFDESTLTAHSGAKTFSANSGAKTFSTADHILLEDSSPTTPERKQLARLSAWLRDNGALGLENVFLNKFDKSLGREPRHRLRFVVRGLGARYARFFQTFFQHRNCMYNKVGREEGHGRKNGVVTGRGRGGPVMICVGPHTGGNSCV